MHSNDENATYIYPQDYPENITAFFNETQCERDINSSFKYLVYSMYSLIFVVALLGNTFICYIVLSSPRMRTVTNYFILNLSIGDVLITLLCVPFTCISMINQYWPFGSFLCPVISYVQALSVFISAYTMVAISIDKYMLIMWPLKPRISKRAATFAILVIWVIAGLTVLPTAAFAKLVQPEEYRVCDKYICQENYEDVGIEYGKLYSEILMFLQYVLPFGVLLFTYTSIAIVIWCHRIPGEAENSRDRRIARSKRKMVKMMVTVVFVFTLCWLPFNILMIFIESVSDRVLEFLYFPFHSLAMSHACYNPIIYCYMNSRFREGLVLLVRKTPCCRGVLSKTRGSSGYPNAGIEGTESTVLHRINTYSTYISVKKKTGVKSSNSSHQIPIRSASIMTSSNSLASRKSRYSPNLMEEPL